MVELFRGRGPEARDPHALRVDAAHDVADRAVLAGGVHRLEDDEQPVGVLGRQARLVLGEQPHALGQQLGRLLLLHQRAGVGGIEVLRQSHPPSGLDTERLDELADPCVTLVGHVDRVAGDGRLLALGAGVALLVAEHAQLLDVHPRVTGRRCGRAARGPQRHPRSRPPRRRPRTGSATSRPCRSRRRVGRVDERAARRDELEPEVGAGQRLQSCGPAQPARDRPRRRRRRRRRASRWRAIGLRVDQRGVGRAAWPAASRAARLACRRRAAQVGDDRRP